MNKEDILESWIMVEHLSEGDISLKSKNVLSLKDLVDNDYYSLFLQEMRKARVNNKNGGVVIFFDIFNFQRITKILQQKYQLKETDEEIRFGDKFRFALFFDNKLNFLKEQTFYTYSGYIIEFNEVPKEKDFREFEDKFKGERAQEFDFSYTDESSDKALNAGSHGESSISNPNPSKEEFNTAIKNLLTRFSIKPEDCRIQPVNNIKNEVTNLHSFFISDLEKAKEVKSENLEKYLFGNLIDRKNLDSKSDSRNFNPDLFEKILQPENYPIGRFPWTTKWPLSLMQQVAVNLSCGYDNNNIRSVNGPPGTGKTTLLKDVFADSIVEQAKCMSQIAEKIEGDEHLNYWKNAKIGALPRDITQKNIIVVSSNNGAVQNIVNEFPLIKDVDENLIDELIEADYFYEIANGTFGKNDIDESKNADNLDEEEADTDYENSDDEENSENIDTQEEDKFWGLFSLEGGKNANMANIATKLSQMVEYLNRFYISNPDVYKDFNKQYAELKKEKQGMQKIFEENQDIGMDENKLALLRENYERNYKHNCEVLHEETSSLEASVKEADEDLSKYQNLYNNKHQEREEVMTKKNEFKEILDMYKNQKLGFFAPRSAKEELKENRRKSLVQYQDWLTKEGELQKEESRLLQRLRDLKAHKEKCLEASVQKKKEFSQWNLEQTEEIGRLENRIKAYRNDINSLNMSIPYEKLQECNPWFGEEFRIKQSKLFITALKVRKEFLFKNLKNLKAALNIWERQDEYLDRKHFIEIAFHWMNLAIPAISSTFASFSRMFKHFGENSLGSLFIDEAGQALPQASVGAIFRSSKVMVVGDPSQIKPVLTLHSNILSKLRNHYGVTEEYLSESASTQTLADRASVYGYYKTDEDESDSWIGIPLWVHRRCKCPMFTISNEISYGGLMVDGNRSNGKTGWFDVKGKANDKYVEEQGEFLLRKIQKMIGENPSIIDLKEKDQIYVISPFSNVAFQLARKLDRINFTRRIKGKPTNVGTIHTFQGKGAPIVFMVLGADEQSSGAANWAVDEANMMNVAATRAKNEFYIVGDKSFYLKLNKPVIDKTNLVIEEYKKIHPDLVDENTLFLEDEKEISDNGEFEVDAGVDSKTKEKQTSKEENQENEESYPKQENEKEYMRGTVTYVFTGQKKYAYVLGEDGVEYTINEASYKEITGANKFIRKNYQIEFIPVYEENKTPYATNCKPFYKKKND